MRRALFLALICALLAGCTLPSDRPLPLLPGNTPAPVVQPEHCTGDGVIQSWLLLPLDPPESELLSAYQDRQIIEFQAQVISSSDDPARLPHRSLTLAEAAEGIALTLDYTGDPPPLVFGQRYRVVAWADFVDAAAATPAPDETPLEEAGPELPASETYTLQVFDDIGLLFLGASDADLRDDPLGIEFENVDGDCPPVSVTSNACVVERQVQPLRIRWDGQELLLLPGEDGQMVHDNALYQVSLFRNRLLRLADPPCPGYYEFRRSVRIERLQPPPQAPIVPPETLTATAPITETAPITPAQP